MEHVLRAAANVSGCDEIVVIGSQAILGSAPDAPDVLLWSQEADVFPRAAPERAEAIDGALGDGSPYATFRSLRTLTNGGAVGTCRMRDVAGDRAGGGDTAPDARHRPARS